MNNMRVGFYLLCFFIIVFMGIGNGGFCPDDGQLPIKHITKIYNLTNSTLPACWNGSTCGQLDVPFIAANQSQPFKHFLPFIPPGWVVSRAFINLTASYCYSQVPFKPTLRILVNNLQLYTVSLDQVGPPCSGLQSLNYTIDLDDCWSFIDYLSPEPVNTISLEVSRDVFFVLTLINVTLETVQLDTLLKNIIPAVLENPFSMTTTGYYYTVYLMNYDSNLIYYCYLVFGAFNASSSLSEVTYSPFTSQWSGSCIYENLPAEYFKLNDTDYNTAYVFIAPDRWEWYIHYTQLKTVIFEQPQIKSIYPTTGRPPVNITVIGNGFNTTGLRTVVVVRLPQYIVGPPQVIDYDLINDTLITFTMPSFSVMTNVSDYVCIQISLNSLTYSDCVTSNSFYYVGPNVHPVTPTHQPSSEVFDFLNWLNENWWSYIVFGALLLAFIIMGSVCIVYKNRKKKYNPGEEVIDDDLENIDPRALININELSVREMIGSGSFAVVYHGYWRKTEVAIKMLQNNIKNEKMSFVKECSLMLNLRHPNVVSLMGVVWNPRLCIITEYCARGDVAAVMLDSKFTIEAEHIRKICIDTCRGLTYLHGANVIHRDLKSRNLLIDKAWNIKVADFGLARAFDEQPGTMTACGTPTHAAPEVIKHLHYTTKADVYSFGICLWEMCARQEPYEAIPGFQVIVAVATKRMRPKIPNTLDPKFANLIRRCWTEDPEMRPDFQELVEIFEEMKLPIPTKKMPWKEEDRSSKKLTISSAENGIKNDKALKSKQSITATTSSDNFTDTGIPLARSPPINMPRKLTELRDSTFSSSQNSEPNE